MNKWSVWAKYEDGDWILVTDGLTEKQARDIVTHMHLSPRDLSVALDVD